MSLLDLPIPQTKNTQLQNTKGLSDGSLAALGNVNVLRDRVVGALKSAPPHAITAIRDYLPSLIALSQQESKGDVAFEFSWNTVVGRNKLSPKDPNYYTYTRPSEELAHVYFAYGLLHYRAARLILKEIPEVEAEDSKTQSSNRAEARKEGVRLLREAAGIFEAAPTLDDNDAARPLDSRTATVRAMQQIALANAQEMMIVSAVESKKGRGLIAKLCFGAAEKFSQTRKALGAGLGSGFHNLKPQLNSYLKAKAELYEALAKGHLGYQSGTEDGAHGVSISYYRSALALLNQITIGDDPSGGLEEIRGRVNAEKLRLQQELNSEISDNDKVYFMKVPKEDELEIPPGVCTTTTLPFTAPAPVDVQFFERATVSGFTLLRCIV